MGFEKGKNSYNQSALRLLSKGLIKKTNLFGQIIKGQLSQMLAVTAPNLAASICIIKILQLRIKKKGLHHFHLAREKKIMKKTFLRFGWFSLA